MAKCCNGPTVIPASARVEGDVIIVPRRDASLIGKIHHEECERWQTATAATADPPTRLP